MRVVVKRVQGLIVDGTEVVYKGSEVKVSRELQKLLAAARVAAG
jgi:hypothetical protein